MKQERIFPRFVVTKKQEKNIKKGHPWIYADEIVESSEIKENGCVVDVFGGKNNYLGSGFYSETSKIRIRLLGNNANEKYDDAFFQRKVKYALEYRYIVMQEDIKACRLIHGESDGLPGLTVDRYNNILVTQVESVGTENNNDVIFCNCGKLCRTSEEVSLFLEQTKKFFSEIVCIDTDELFCVRR